MDMNQLALFGYYTKCGAPEEDAKIISLYFGSRFIELQAAKRSQGHGTKAKASAATHISDYYLRASSSPGFQFLNEAKTQQDVNNLNRTVKAACMCSAAVYAYALEQDESSRLISEYRSFMGAAKKKAEELGGSLNVDQEIRILTETTSRCVIEALALGKRKGFFSRLLG